MSESRIEKPTKPLGRRAYGSIGHLPNSRLGTGDHKVSPGQARICCERVRDKFDRVIVQQKYDGTNVAVALVNGELVALQRRGYPCRTSPHEQHHLFADWVDANADRFREALGEGEHLIGLAAGAWLSVAGPAKWTRTLGVLFAFIHLVAIAQHLIGR